MKHYQIAIYATGLALGWTIVNYAMAGVGL